MTKQKHLPRAYWLLLLIAGVIYALMALSDNIWADEAYTFAMLPHSFSEILSITAADVHPPLYYFVTKLLTAVFGYSQYSLRLFSGCCYLLVIAVGGWQLTKLFNEKTGLLFMLLYLLYPFSLEHAPQARMYSFASLGIFLCALFAYRVWLLEKVGDWVGFVASGLCAAYTHYFALVAAGVIYGLLLLCCLLRKRRLLGAWLLAAVATILLYLPWLKCLLEQLVYKANNEYWIGAITVQSLFQDLISLLHANGFSAFPLFFGLMGLGLVVWFFLKKKAPPLLALAVPVITLLLGVAVSALMRPIFIIRYLVPCAPLIIFFVAYGVASIKKEYLRGGVVFLLLAAFCSNLIFAFQDILPNSAKFGAAAVSRAESAEAYVLQVSNHLHVSQVVAYYAPEATIYTPETLGAASPYENIRLLEQFPEEGLEKIALLTDPEAEPDDSLFPDYHGTKLGTYYAAYDTFDLWLMEAP